MTLGARLRKHIAEGVEQKVIAMDWIERTKQADLKPLSPSTAVSRLSELLADSPQGVRAFFRDPRRANALFDVLQVSEPERVELRALAETILAGDPHPRLIVDLSDLGKDRATMDAAFGDLREALFGKGGIFPVAFVLTEAQYDLLPRSFDRFKDQFRLEQVVDASAGAEVAERLAGEHTCLLSRRPLVPLDQWWALDVGEEALRLEPEDGLARIRDTGSLGTFAVAHPLEALALPASDRVASAPKVPAVGADRRRLIADLADEGSAVSKKDPRWRTVAARELGVQATSTARERIEADLWAIIRNLGMEVTTGTTQEWEALVGGAKRRPSGPLAMRIGDRIHVLNPDKEIGARDRLEVVQVRCAEPLLQTLERAVAELTEDSLLDDPLLGRLIHQLAAGDPLSLKVLFHARAVLVYGSRVHLKAAKAVGDPLPVLRQLISGDVPQAQLRVRVDAEPRPYGWSDLHVQVAPFAYPDGRIFYKELEESKLLYGVPPVGDVLFGRESELKGGIPATGWESERKEDRYGYSWGRSWARAGSPPALVDPTADSNKWLDDIEASPFLGAKSNGYGWSPERHLPEPKEDHQWHPIEEPEDLWLNADTHLALAWLALREALVSPRWIRMPDGSILLQVGGGLAARVLVRQHGEAEAALRGAVRCTVHCESDSDGRGGRWRFGDLAAPVTTHVAQTRGYSTRISVLMPSVWIAGRGHAVDVQFIPAPMLPGGIAVTGDAIVAAAGAAAAAARVKDDQ